MAGENVRIFLIEKGLVRSYPARHFQGGKYIGFYALGATQDETEDLAN